MCRTLCQGLAQSGSFEQQAVAQQRLDDIDPVLRFAKYQLGQQQGAPDASEIDTDLQVIAWHTAMLDATHAGHQPSAV